MWNFRNYIGKVIGWDWLNSVRIDAQTLEKVAETASPTSSNLPMRLSHWLVQCFSILLGGYPNSLNVSRVLAKFTLVKLRESGRMRWML